MPNFEPNSIIHIGRVPFDNSYRHTMTFANATAQSTYFSSVCPTALAKEDYTYVRMNNAIRVPFNAETLYTYNYVMYKNANYGDKWFYAFIVGVNYVNSKTTELLLEIDVMQTWYFDYELTACFVEREHVDDDTIGAHLNPEPEMPMNLVVKSASIPLELEKRMVVVQTTSHSKYLSGNPLWPSDIPAGHYAVSGGMYQGIFSGAKYYKFKTDDEIEGDDQFHDLVPWLEALNSAGGAEGVSAIFMYPEELFNEEAGSDHGLPTNTTHTSIPRSVSRPTSLDRGYVPRNNKLFTYPYCFFRITNNNGSQCELKWELWNETSTGYDYAIESVIEPSAQAFVIPHNYNGVGENVDAGLNFPVTAQCSWTYSAYQNWLAQNAVANAISIGTAAAALVIPAARGVSAAVKALDAGKKGVTAAANLGSKAQLGAMRNTQARAVAAGKEAATSGYGGLSMAAGAYGVGQVASDYAAQSLVPNTMKGQANGNSLMGIGHQRIVEETIVPQLEFCKILDGFFDMYGYQVDSVKVPNRTGRPSWNYVKCQNACNHGNVPADHMALINDIYNTGVTFWHTSDVGNYSLSNK